MEIPVTIMYGVVMTLLLTFAVMYFLFIQDITKTEKAINVTLPHTIKRLLMGNLILTLVTIGISLLLMIL